MTVFYKRSKERQGILQQTRETPWFLDRRRKEFMSKVIVFTNLTLDGVMQAPARPDEDRRRGFEHGAWGAPYNAMALAGGSQRPIPALLLGARTSDDFYSSVARPTAFRCPPR